MKSLQQETIYHVINSSCMWMSMSVSICFMQRIVYNVIESMNNHHKCSRKHFCVVVRTSIYVFVRPSYSVFLVRDLYVAFWSFYFSAVSSTFGKMNGKVAWPNHIIKMLCDKVSSSSLWFVCTKFVCGLTTYVISFVVTPTFNLCQSFVNKFCGFPLKWWQHP